ncbi:hypothetical protein FO440_19655 [Mucilaginibacter corticis]|uniref:Toxin-antitoxin system YwqK family antitoxin n=1 Tax=Mucilaginibacter corticis TaxID=2597670 RepID=A0A556MFY3_9SPHI|nr:hypothetical protein [Mucilaginibacter corticis]TSJ38722.1 hypothetical protein FO440_19655 [Mucilaginibacter corticis]
MSLRVNYDDLEIIGFDGGGIEMFNYEGQPFTGIVVSMKDGVVYTEEEYQNGYKEGLQKEYFFTSGVLRFEFTVRNNNLNGVFKTWDENGNLVKQSNWKDGAKIS